MNCKLLLLSVVFVLIPVSAARPMTSLLANQLEASMVEIGMLTVCYSLVPLLLAVGAGRFVDRFGEKMPLIMGSAGIAGSLSLVFFNPILPILYGSQLLLGGAQLLALVAIQNGVARSTEDVMDKAMGNFSLFASLGTLIGPLIGGYATEHFGFQLTYLFLSFFSIVSLIFSLFISSSLTKADSSDHDHVNRIGELLSLPGLGRSIFVSMLNLAAVDIFYAYFPLMAISLGMSPSGIGWILAIQGTSNAAVRFFMPQLVERYGRIRILWAFMSIGAIAYGVVPFLHSFIYFVITAAFLGMGLGVAQPLTLVLCYKAAPEGKTAVVLGMRLAGNRLAQVTIPFMFAGLSNMTGLAAIFTIKAVVLGLGAWLARGIHIGEKEQDSS